jgi:hypothetical protein
MIFIKYYLLILPLFVAVCVILLPRLTCGLYLVLSLKPGATRKARGEAGPSRPSGRTLGREYYQTIKDTALLTLAPHLLSCIVVAPCPRFRSLARISSLPPSQSLARSLSLTPFLLISCIAFSPLASSTWHGGSAPR